MFVYEKKLQYPVNIKKTNAKLAKIIITQYGGTYTKRYKRHHKRSSNKATPFVLIIVCIGFILNSIFQSVNYVD